NLSSTSWGKFIFYNDVNANYHTFTKYGSAVAGNYGGASTLFPYANLLVFGSNNSPTVMANGHNIGFATVNGGTAYFKFIGMQSTGNVGLGGNATPATSIHINRTDANGDTLKITNNTTGHTATDGLDIRVTGNAAQIIHRENSSLSIGTNNGIAITVAPSNNVGIGTANPGAALDVNGQLKIQGGSPGIGKVLTSDASGIGTWITPSITSAVGTANYLPRFGASGNTLVNSSLIDYNNVLLYNSLSAPSNFTGIHFKLKGNGNGNHLLLEGQKVTSFTFFSAIDSGSGRKGFLAGQSSSFYVYNDSSVLLAYDPATQITSLSSNGINYNGLAIHNISGRIGNGSWLSYPSDIGNAHFNINSTYDTAANFTSSSPNLLGNGILRSEYNGSTIADHVAINGVAKPAANYGIGVKGEGGYYGVFGMTDANGTAGVYGLSAGNVNGVYGRSNTGNGVYGTTTTGNGVMGTVNPLTAGVATGGRFLGKQTGVYGQADSASLQQTFVWGLFSGFKEAVGVHGYSNMNSTANTFSNVGLAGSSWSNSYINFGTITEAQGGSYNYGIYAYAPPAPGVNYAGYFGGDVHVSGTLSKSGGTFKIDHPVDPENKYLIHSFVESPDMMNVYNGNIITDANGYATVELPSYFEAENKEYKYQLTVIDPSADFIFAKVTSEVSNNRFTIRTSKPDVKVSWQVTGVRKDPWANANRVVAEVDKSENDKGYYLNPELYGKPATQTVGPKKPNAHASSTINFPERRFENDLLNVVEKEHEERNKAVKAQYKSQPARKAETTQQASIGK
ncbi:MAG: hypothetical protein JNM95_11900, partial [Chitinophagaceae bacterium]|nr:hypothetical protein [Chitinophagaceae bacterium]